MAALPTSEKVIGSTAFGFIIAMVTVIVETMDPQVTRDSGKPHVFCLRGSHFKLAISYNLLPKEH